MVRELLGGRYSLLRGIVGESDALLNVALEALNGSFEESLLLFGDVAKDIDSLLGTVGLEI